MKVRALIPDGPMRLREPRPRLLPPMTPAFAAREAALTAPDMRLRAGLMARIRNRLSG